MRLLRLDERQQHLERRADKGRESEQQIQHEASLAERSDNGSVAAAKRCDSWVRDATMGAWTS